MRHRHVSSNRPASAPDALRTGRVDDVLCGINTVHEALRLGRRRLHTIWLADGKAGKRLREILALAAERGTPVEILAESRLTDAAGTLAHQGIVAFAAPTPLLTIEGLAASLTSQTPSPPLVILDGVKDPRNLGAIIRAAAAFGLGGVIVPKRRAVGITATVAKAAAGGLEHVALAEVTNISQSLERLKQLGFWVVGADEQGNVPCNTFAFPVPLALVFGEEGAGLSPLVKRHCDVLARIPVGGPLRSLNVAVAAGVLFYEVMGQLRTPREPLPPSHAQTSCR
jgi:23S rRNA (guanosine2251-2'-O)-methyltransferase